MPSDRYETVLPSTEMRDGEPAPQDPKRRFERVDALGEGAMGVVELSHDHDIGRLVAIKSLKESHDPEQVLRFTREVQSLGQLEHQGIVPVHDVGRAEDGSYFLVMKHLVGESLESVIRRLRTGDAAMHATYSMHERLRICEAVLHIMEYAHERGVIHRDLKPANIMIGPHGEVTVVDWGLSKRIDRADEREAGSPDPAVAVEPDDAVARGSRVRTRAGTRMGTPIYMSPEQASGASHAVGTASDFYSMGVVFYEFLVLEHYLHDKVEIHDVLDGVRSTKPRLAYWVVRDDQQRLPIEIAYWLDKAMSKSATERFASSTRMREELQRLVDGKFSVVCPTTLTRRFFRVAMDTANQRPLVTLVALGALLGLAVFGAVSLVLALL